MIIKLPNVEIPRIFAANIYTIIPRAPSPITDHSIGIEQGISITDHSRYGISYLYQG